MTRSPSCSCLAWRSTSPALDSGHGAGYYDRFLARLSPSVLRIGVTSGYLVSELPREVHDVPMTHLATEIGVIAVRPAS